MVNVKRQVTYVLASLVFSFFVFLMVEVLAAYIIKERIATRADFATVAWLLVGFNVLGAMTALGVQSWMHERNHWAIVLAFVINAGVWIIVPWGVVLGYHPGVVSEIHGAEYLLAIPQYIAVFAIYYFASPAYFWLVYLLTFHGFLLGFALLLEKTWENKRGDETA